MGTAKGQKIFALHGDAAHKDSLNLSFRQQYPQLFNLLDSLPLLAFSPVGKSNVCRRFHLSEQELESVLLTYTRPDAPTEAERRAADLLRLLRVIEEVVVPTTVRKSAARKDKKGGAQC
jgi:hypothetical protein